MISSQMASDIMNCAFKTEFHMFKVKNLNSMSLWPLPVTRKKVPKNDQNTQKQEKQDYSLGAFFKVRHKMLLGA